MPSSTHARVRIAAVLVALTTAMVCTTVVVLETGSSTTATAAGTPTAPVTTTTTTVPTTTTTPAPAPTPATWTGSWATALTTAAPGSTAERGFTDTTLRQVVHLSLGGPQVRLRLSNAHGTAPLVVGRTTVAVAGAPGAAVPVRFTRATSTATTTIAPGGQLVSDPVDLRAPDGADLVVTTYLPGPTGPATTHRDALATSATAPGSTTAAAAFTPLDGSSYYLAGVDVPAPAPASVVLLGDSLLDGAASTLDGDARPSDALAARLLADRRRVGVLNAGISGNRLLVDGGITGAAAVDRLDTDVLSQTGVRAVLVLVGTNDLHADGTLTADTVVAGYTSLVQRARAAGLTVLLATVPPAGGYASHTAAAETTRQAVNTWIRTSGVPDAVVDVDLALRDPADPGRLLPAYDSGDHLHPGDAGYVAMAAAVDLTTLPRA